MFGENRSKSVESRRRQEQMRKVRDYENRKSIEARYAYNAQKSRGGKKQSYASRSIREGIDDIQFVPQTKKSKSIFPLNLYKKRSTANTVYARISLGTVNGQIPTLDGNPINEDNATFSWSKNGQDFKVYIAVFKNGNTPQILRAGAIPKNTVTQANIILATVSGKNIQNVLSNSIWAQICGTDVYTWSV